MHKSVERNDVSTAVAMVYSLYLRAPIISLRFVSGEVDAKVYIQYDKFILH